MTLRSRRALIATLTPTRRTPSMSARNSCVMRNSLELTRSWVINNQRAMRCVTSNTGERCAYLRRPELLAYLMDQHGLCRADLIPLLGTASRVSEVLNGKRELSMTMVRRLRDRFRTSADLLVSHGGGRKPLAA